MRQGCLNIFLRLGTSVVSAALIAVGALLLLVGLLLSSEPLEGVRMVLSILAALVVAFLFVLVGLSILRDLREPEDTDREESDEETPPDDG